MNPEQHLGPLGPDRPGFPEQRHPVGDRLHAGQRTPPGGECIEDEQDGHRLEARRRQLRRPRLWLVEAEGVDEADGDDGQESDDEHRRGQQEGARRLAQAAQVEHHDEQEDPQAQRDGGPVERREGRLEAGDSGGDGDGDGQRVVDDQRCRGDEARVGAEVRPGDGVGAAAHRIGVDDLAVGEHQDRQEGDDGDRDGEDEVQSPGARHGQHEDDRLGPVCNRGQSVEGQGREALDGSDALLPGAPR